MRRIRAFRPESGADRILARWIYESRRHCVGTCDIHQLVRWLIEYTVRVGGHRNSLDQSHIRWIEYIYRVRVTTCDESKMARRIDDDAMGLRLRSKTDTSAASGIARARKPSCRRRRCLRSRRRDRRRHGQVVEQGESTRFFQLRKDNVAIESKLWYQQVGWERQAEPSRHKGPKINVAANQKSHSGRFSHETTFQLCRVCSRCSAGSPRRSAAAALT